MYDALVTLLRSTGIPLAEGDWNIAPQTGSYAAVALDLEGETLWGNDSQRQQAIQGTVNLFCRTPDRTDFNTMQRALKATGISWRLNSIQREVSRKLYHYEWVFELEDVNEDSLFYERFPGLQVYVDGESVSCPEIEPDSGMLVMDPLGLYVDADENVGQRYLEGV